MRTLITNWSSGERREGVDVMIGALSKTARNRVIRSAEDETDKIKE